MKKQVAIFFLGLLCVRTLLLGLSFEINTSYDYFRGIPDGSWNGNTGALVAANSGITLFECVNVQLGGSYGFYNWDGRGNIVFDDSDSLEHIGFLTAGMSSSIDCFSAGIVYDRMFTNHFGILNLDPSVDQIRFQFGYAFCSDEVGIWGTYGITKSQRDALGLPVTFRAIGQLNVWWSHYFDNCASTTLWVGAPYQESLMFPHQRAGKFDIGFSFQAPLTECLYFVGHGSYMSAHNSNPFIKGTNYAASLSIGLSYFFAYDINGCEYPYMKIANHSNFFVDTDTNL